MSEPDDPRWLTEITDELRREVIVRPAWRSRLLDDVARSPRPAPGDPVDVRFDDGAEAPLRAAAGARHRRAIVVSPVVGLAAAIVLVVLGAGIAYSVLTARMTGGDGDGHSSAAIAARLATDAPPTKRELVRFELAAPAASRVMLVGSFNEWNPAATPLVRDAATGRWTVSLRLPPGRHVYAFVVDGNITSDPTAPRTADDDFGSTNSVVFVAAPRT